MKRIFLFCFLLLTLISCQDDYLMNQYLLDNSTNTEIEILLDNKKYVLKPLTFKKITLEPGVHNITTIKNKRVIVDNESFEIKDIHSGVINPAKSECVIYEILFTRYTLDFLESAYNVKPVSKKPIIATDLFIPDPTLGIGNIHKKVPKKMTIYNNDYYKYHRKIFRKIDFLMYAQEFK